MLGVRRTSVSLCAHTLQKSGFIQYARGNMKIQNRQGLEECACECYSAIRERINSFRIGQVYRRDEGEVVRCQLVIARRNSPTLFDLIEKSLDQFRAR